MKQNMEDSTQDVRQEQYESPAMEIIGMEVEDAVLAGGASGGNEPDVPGESSVTALIREKW